MSERQVPANAMPTRMNGRLFPSMMAAARALGVSYKGVQDAVAQGRDTIRLGGRRWNSKPLEFEGRSYPSQVALAEALGVCPKGLNRALNDGRLAQYVARARRKRQ